MKDQIVLELQQYFISKERTLSVAESCTGGHLAARITRQAGCSNYFKGGVIAYSNEVKMQLLKVDADAIFQFGAVSREVVLQMACGVQLAFDTDYSLAVSGIAGPSGGTPLKPVGTIWAAIGKKGGEGEAWSFHLNGSREDIINATVDRLIEKLKERIKHP